MMRLLGLLPTVVCGWIIHCIASIRRPRWAGQVLIRIFIRMYRINTEEIEHPVREYRSLFDFFIRRLKPGIRPEGAEHGTLLAPVDARFVGTGSVTQELTLKIKNGFYTAAELLGSGEAAAPFAGGSFGIFHLRPFDYHRIHMPADGQVTGHMYIKGRLLPVKEKALRVFPRLFARNRRRVTLFEGPAGSWALVQVGALNVGRMPVEYPVPCPRGVCTMIENGPVFRAGDEIGRFELGSTVVLFFPAGAVQWDPLEPDTEVRYGQPIGRVTASA